MLSEQDAFAPLLGSQPDAEREAKCPFPRDNTAVVGHEDRAICLRLIGFRDFAIAIEDRFDGAQFGAVFVQRRLPAIEDQRYPISSVPVRAGEGPP
jgi:hypothetical protein